MKVFLGKNEIIDSENTEYVLGILIGFFILSSNDILFTEIDFDFDESLVNERILLKNVKPLTFSEMDSIAQSKTSENMTSVWLKTKDTYLLFSTSSFVDFNNGFKIACKLFSIDNHFEYMIERLSTNKKTSYLIKKQQSLENSIGLFENDSRIPQPKPPKSDYFPDFIDKMAFEFTM